MGMALPEFEAERYVIILLGKGVLSSCGSRGEVRVVIEGEKKGRETEGKFLQILGRLLSKTERRGGNYSRKEGRPKLSGWGRMENGTRVRGPEKNSSGVSQREVAIVAHAERRRRLLMGRKIIPGKGPFNIANGWLRGSEITVAGHGRKGVGRTGNRKKRDFNFEGDPLNGLLSRRGGEVKTEAYPGRGKGTPEGRGDAEGVTDE